MHLLRTLCLSLLAVFATVSSQAVQAVTLKFTLTGDYSAVWNYNQNPTVLYGTVGDGFTAHDAQGTFPTSAFGYVADVDFYNISQGGGLGIYDPPYAVGGPVELLLLSGAQLYTGSELTPTFLLGTFSLVNGVTGLGSYTLTIAECAVCTAVPEPDTWAMMLIGFGVVGGALRSRRRVAATLRFALPTAKG
jgi:hypothetical protein